MAHHNFEEDYMSMIQKARGSEGFVGIDVSKATLDICFGK